MFFIKVGRLNIHYEHRVNGDTPIIFLHGNFGSWHYWQPFLQHLPIGYSAYAPDFRGCGDSDVSIGGYDIKTLSQDILLFADQLKLERFHLVGHSLGGAVAQELAGNSPDRILSLTLVAPAPADGLKALPQSALSNSFFSSKSVFNFLDNIGLKRNTLVALFKKSMPGLRDNEAYLKMLVDDAIKMDIKAFDGFIATLRTWNGSALLQRFDFPVLIIYGDLDPVIPLQPLIKMQQEIKDCRFYTFKGIGHSPQLESPSAFNTVLSAFIRGEKQADNASSGIVQESSHLIDQLKLKFMRFLNK
ncbi:MAG: alpha/beta hydrolase [Cycloclasticus sp.]